MSATARQKPAREIDCNAMSAFLRGLGPQVSSTLGIAAAKHTLEMEALELSVYPPLLRLPVFVSAALDAVEYAARGFESVGIATRAKRIVAAARRMHVDNVTMTIRERIELQRFIRNTLNSDSLTPAAVFAACAANGLACVKTSGFYFAIDDDKPFDAKVDGFPGALSAGTAIAYAWSAAAAIGPRSYIVNIAEKAINDAIAPERRS